MSSVSAVGERSDAPVVFRLRATTHFHVELSVHPSVWCAERSVSDVVSRADSFRRETLIED
jgi:hypothetical protein